MFFHNTSDLLHLVHGDSQRHGHPLTIGRVGFEAVLDVPDLNEFRRITHVASGILNQNLQLVLAHQLE